MAQISVEIIRLPGSLLRGNLHFTINIHIKSSFMKNNVRLLMNQIHLIPPVQTTPIGGGVEQL